MKNTSLFGMLGFAHPEPLSKDLKSLCQLF
jgi:hypothetical protein